MVERKEKPFNIFPKVTIGKTSYKKNFREKRIRETGLGGNSRNSICHFVLFLHLVVKPLGMNVTIFPLNFIQKSRPYVLHTNQKQ